MKFDVFPKVYVSILVLMDLCIKTQDFPDQDCQDNRFNPCFNGSMYKNSRLASDFTDVPFVSILVLMDLCIKTKFEPTEEVKEWCFNPCFNGSMYKNPSTSVKYFA